MAGGLLILSAGIFDMFAGAMPRVRNTAATLGAFFDSMLDHYAESVILIGLLLYSLQRPDLHDAMWPFANEQRWMITAILIAVVGSLMVSYIKSHAKGLSLECKTGMLARPGRVIIFSLCPPMFRRLIMVCIKKEDNGINKHERTGYTTIQRSRKILPENKVGRDFSHLQSKYSLVANTCAPVRKTETGDLSDNTKYSFRK